MMVSIFINGRFLSQRMSGVQRYALETLLALDELIDQRKVDDAWSFTLLAPPGARALALRHVRFRRVGRLRGHAWEQVSLMRAARDGFLISFGPTGPLLKRRQIVTIHDAAVIVVPESYAWQFRAFYRLVLPILARRCAAVVTVSEFSKKEVVEHFGASPERTHVSGGGWQHVSRFRADHGVLDKHGLRTKRYVLAVSNISPHKNFGVVIDALRLLRGCDYDVVIAGGTNSRVFGSARELPSWVKLIGYASDAELRSLYEHAGVFVYPSKYEGFGIPPLEALALGCPVIASNAGAIPEVCGAGARYFSPGDAPALAQAIHAVMSIADEREALVETGAAQLRRYSWKASALSHVAAMRDALGPG